MPHLNNSMAGSLIGRTVRNSAGENLGKVEDLVIDPSTGAISFAVLSFGGLLGVGDKLVAIPWSALELSSGRDYVLLNVDKNVLVHAPSFDRNHWPDTSDPAWRSRVY